MAVNTVHGVRQPKQEVKANVRVWPVRGQTIMGLLFLVALLAFEIFNFDTTRFALSNFLGEAAFAGLRWATVLAIAFCAIDFAGLLRFFLPQDEEGQMPAEVWYLMGAWLLGATMNALMTWWAVNLALLNHDFGNEVLSRQQLLEVVPIFVATLVWITRILFIGAFTVAGGYLFNFDSLAQSETAGQKQRPGVAMPAGTPLALRRNAGRSRRWRPALEGEFLPVSDDLPPFLQVLDEDDDDESAGELLPAAAWATRRAQRRHANAMQEG